MGGGRAQVNKAHKTRFASKASRHAHKIDKVRSGKPESSHRAAVKGARASRIQQSKAIRDKKRADLLKEKRSSKGSSGAPRVIVLVGLSSSANVGSLAKDLLTFAEGGDGKLRSSTVASPIYKLRTTVLQAPYGDLTSCMELAKVADLLAFVLPSNSLYSSDSSSPIDDFGSQCLSVFRAMGLPSTAVFIRDLPADNKSRQELKKAATSFLSAELPEDCKFYFADTKDDLHKFMWLFKEQHLSSPHWRNQRPYIMSEQVCIKPNDNTGLCTLLVSGYLRAHNLSVNQLVGDLCQKISYLSCPFPFLISFPSKRSMFQIVNTFVPDSSNQEPLLVENVPDPLAGEQTWPTEEDMEETNINNKQRKLVKRKLPRGTSEYQAAWIVDDTDDEDNNSDNDNQAGSGMVIDEQGHADLGSDGSDIDAVSHFTEKFDEETVGDTEMADEENLSKEQIEAEIKKIKEANAEDEEFPDEVETPLDVPAKKRFAKYRGLKSFRTSSWDPKESLPPEYARIFAFDNFTRTQKHVLAKIAELDGGTKDCALVGSYVRLYVTNIPSDIASKLCHPSRRIPVVVSGLLQHESKMSVLHFSIKKHDSYEAPIKSKEPLIFNVGFRQFTARPLFSSDNINCNKHKMERFLHHGRFSVASVYAPICFPPLPLIVLKNTDGEQPVIAAVGSLKSADPDRIILKKIVLTGYPQRVSKLKAIVRYMFHNPEDVKWFKASAMKCIFNSSIQQHDTVCMSLFKRAYPKWPEQLYQV
ncbi:Pre-rRNA-processing protein TSR1-like protein [Dichanthelium oligosanthes]|uniref:Pre-rRNA-processing protein TSR1-like protein n=1 Tax=Dichanthelium oligosanthes TaxID=888268 RepID=A0A1E5V754_9POAL|nr:Pre-rRNA-processing protein TSR1-like protein [Dichanthelium oligosanthes]